MSWHTAIPQKIIQAANESFPSYQERFKFYQLIIPAFYEEDWAGDPDVEESDFAFAAAVQQLQTLRERLSNVREL